MARGKRIQIVRVPHAYRFDAVDIREEHIITMLHGYLDAVGFTDYAIHDFHLQRQTKFEDTLDLDATDYVLSVRETGDQIHYLRRYVKALREHTNANIWLYGQTARLHALDWPQNVHIAVHDERRLAEAMGLPQGPSFADGLTCKPYAPQLDLQPWQRRLWRGSFETTRGCHYPCRFCFINSGENYSKRWQLRPTEAILADLRRYRELGVTSVTFYDSEFLGAVRTDYESRRTLLRAMRDELPGTQFMIWCRADTMLAFDEFELLKEAGLVNVLIGVESFSQLDLDALKKRIKVTDVIRCIERLRDLDIHVNMSFLTFNRNTSAQTLRQNLETLERLMTVKPRLLGLPHFNFTFESSWDEKRELRPLSNRTYMNVDVMMRSQQLDGACWDPKLEPLMEIYRLLKYEWSRKVIDLTMERLTADDQEQAQIEDWFDGLGQFCIRVMRHYLDRFERGTLTFDGLHESSDELFEQIGDYNRRLPERMRAFVTRDRHAVRLDYAGTTLVEEDQYWAGYIPFAPGEVASGAPMQVLM
jgi:hypothetical protein